MTDLEISNALALAIGWQYATVSGGKVWVNLKTVYAWGNKWQVFDYRDWNVIGPIAERYNGFPRKSRTKYGWRAEVDGCEVYADTPQKAIALAVIGANK